MSSKKGPKNFATFLLYILSFFLLWEWLRPVEQLTDTGNLGLFLGFVIMALLLAFLKVPTLLKWTIKMVYILYQIQFVYYEGSVFNLSWIRSFFTDVIRNLGLVWNGDFITLSNPFRTFLFFILLWIMAYLIHYWLLKTRRILIFFFMTIVFITVLDTFTPYEGDMALVRSVIVGFTIMGMLTFYRLVEKENIRMNYLPARKWMIPLAVMVAGSALIGYTSPKSESIWPDPVPAFLMGENGNGGAGARRAGYGSDDSNLGGPFVGDNTVVFRAEVEQRHYWKVETKDLYTGKGWNVLEPESFNENAFIDFSNGSPIQITSFYSEDPEDTKTSKVYNQLDYGHIQYPHGVVKLETENLYLYRLNPLTERISSFKDFEAEAPSSYTVQYKVPSFQVETLQNGKPSEDEYFTNYIINNYTQLPEDLPASVRELALEITEGKENWFDKVDAVENYFQSNGFVYDQVNVAVPEEGEDYVAQFLFETKRGYCDNFSTSMAVLLRTLDIPTRWVKGYTSGDYVRVLDSGNRMYEVTNNHAHSWVEVYFPEVGWVPFEPTKGFSNNIAFRSETNNVTQVDFEEVQETIAPTPGRPELQEAGSPSNFTNNISNKVEGLGSFFKAQHKGIIIIIAFILVIGVYFTRGKWLPFYYIFIFKSQKEDKHFPSAYLALLAQLERFGLKRKSGQTLREYAREVDSQLVGREMRVLTDQYEQFLYRGKLKEGTWLETKEVWEELMKKIAT
ncbi:MAG: transglutaminase domain-containing protein [Bacillota bacterium]